MIVQAVGFPGSICFPDGAPGKDIGNGAPYSNPLQGHDPQGTYR